MDDGPELRMDLEMRIDGNAVMTDFCWNYCRCLLDELKALDGKSEIFVVGKFSQDDEPLKRTSSFSEGDLKVINRLLLTLKAAGIIKELSRQIPKAPPVTNDRRSRLSEEAEGGCPESWGEFDAFLAYCEWYLGIFKKKKR